MMELQKNKKVVAVTLDAEVHERVKVLCNTHSLTIKGFAQDAILAHLAKFKNRRVSIRRDTA